MKKFIFNLLLLAITAQLFATVAFAATNSIYTSELCFHGEHKGTVHEYTGSHMHWSGTTYEEYSNAENPTVFSVSLYRKGAFYSGFIGKKECPREGYHHIIWTNVGSGKYYFYYTKARDGANVCSDLITMKMTS